MVDITIKIPNDKIDELRIGFLAAVPKEDEGLTDMEFFKKWLKHQIINIYKTGKTIIARQTTLPVIDDDIVEDVI